MPGGGVDYGEDIVAGLGRELHEEIGIQKITHAKLLSAHPYFSTAKQKWWLWLVYEVQAQLPKTFAGELATGAAFVDITSFKDSTNKAERRIYEALAPSVY